MRIEQAPPYVVRIRGSEAAAAAKAAPAKEQNRTAKGPVQEIVVISPRMREIASLREQLSALPEVRTEMVALAKQQMQYGPYRIEPGEVAQKLVDSLKRG